MKRVHFAPLFAVLKKIETLPEHSARLACGSTKEFRRSRIAHFILLLQVSSWRGDAAVIAGFTKEVSQFGTSLRLSQNGKFSSLFALR